MERKKSVFNWSGGKDSAHALWRAMQSDEYEIVALLTTANRSTRRSTMHGIPESLLLAQAERIGVPLHVVDLAPQGGMEDYGEAMTRAVGHFRQQGVTHFIFGDIFLHDVRSYREAQLAPLGIEVVEPLWGRSSAEVMRDFLDSGLRTVVVTTMADGLGAAAVGREIDRDFVASLPAGSIPTARTASTTPSVTTARSSARPCRSAWANLSCRATTSATTTARCTPTPTGSPTFRRRVAGRAGHAATGRCRRATARPACSSASLRASRSPGPPRRAAPAGHTVP